MDLKKRVSKHFVSGLLLAMVAFAPLFAEADSKVEARGNHFLSQYIKAQTPFALNKLVDAFIGAREIISQKNQELPGYPGAIIAAPSAVEDKARGEVQDYRWRWKRDSALVMRSIVRMMIDGEMSSLESEKKEALIKAYVEFCLREQEAHRLENGEYDLAHAKVTLKGERNPYMWGYPQNDGPPLEIYALVDSLQLLEQLDSKNSDLHRDIFQLIGRNNDFILKHYLDAAVERWEEAKADSHFSIWLEMRGALSLVQKLSKTISENFHPLLGKDLDQGPRAIAHLSHLILSKHISNDGHIVAHTNLHRQNSLAYDKDSALDTQVLMSSIATNKYWQNPSELFLSPSHPALRATFQKLREAFVEKYPVNRSAIDPFSGEPLRGVVFGRYPEDHSHFRGSPWFITSFTAVQFLLWDALYVSDKGVIQIHKNDFSYFYALNVAGDELNLRKQAGAWPIVIRRGEPLFDRLRDGLVRLAKESFYRVAIHAGSDGLTEIFDGESGFKGGIEHLTWSYVEFLKTVRLMRRAQRDFGLNLDLDLSINPCELILN